MIRFLIQSILRLSIALALLSGAVIFFGFQEPPSEWVQLLHLNDWKLPCWIGIEPGKTTYDEAEKRIETVYAGASLDLYKTGNFYYYTITMKPTGYTLLVTLQPDLEQAGKTVPVVSNIYLQPFIGHGLSFAQPKIAELYSSLGSAEAVRRITGEEANRLALLFNNQQANVIVDDLECDKVLPNQQISTIYMSDQPPGDNVAWLSPPSSWHGFNNCYNLELKIYP